MRRRTIVRTATGAIALAPLAGCLDTITSIVASPGDDPAEGDDADPEDGIDDPPEPIVDTAIQTTGTDCGTTNEASPTVDGTAVRVSGSIAASDPCHEAILAAASLEDGVLAVTIDVEATGAGLCAQCLGEIAYEATIELHEDVEVSSVEVFHGEADEVVGRTGN